MTSIESQDKIEAYGTFTPPPPPCGGEHCRYQGIELIHDPECEEA